MAERTYLYGYGSGPWGSSGTRRTKSYILGQTQWKVLAPELMRRLFGLADYVIDAGSDYGFGGGGRTTLQQYNLFKSRYVKVPAGTLYNVYWDGSPLWPNEAGFYRHVSGASVAPPGRSYHEQTTKNGTGYALAADMIGNHALANQFDSQFYLKDFHDVNQEPWHFQPIECPTARMNYRSHFENPTSPPLPNDPATDMTPHKPERTYDSRESGGEFGPNEVRRIPVVFDANGQAQIGGGVQNRWGVEGWWSYSPDGDFSNPTSFVNAYGDGRWYNFGGIDVLAPGGHIYVKSLSGGHIYVDRYSKL